jgi:cellulose synthase/poly-beta-1,6-N-acetylglucosamine synthase-like glycosyltransferase
MAREREPRAAGRQRAGVDSRVGLLIESDVSAMATERSVARDRDEVLVSLIMPVWNPRPDWLHAAIESALAQRGCAIELIVVDNGNDTPVARCSPDVRDPRLRIIRTQHGGVSAARNAGMAEARGDFLRFLDCDDVFEPTARVACSR